VHDDYQILDLKEGCEDLQQSTLQFLAQMLECDRQVRDDYQKLIELTMVILGSPPDAIHWRSLGPVHHARWMAKLLYAMKIILFREQIDVFQLIKAEETSLSDSFSLGSFCTVRHGQKLHLQRPQQEIWSFVMTSQNMSKLMHQLGRLKGLFVNGIYDTCQTNLLVWHCFLSRLQISVTPFVPVLLFSSSSGSLALSCFLFLLTRDEYCFSTS